MTDQDTGADETQAASATQPQAGADSPSQAEGAPTAQAAGAAAESGTGPDLSSLTRENADLKKEAQGLRTRLKALEKADQDRATAGLSDLEKAQARIAELERDVEDRTRQQQESRLRMASLAAAQRIGFRNPDLAYSLLNGSGATVEYSEDGEPKNVEQLLRDLAKADPYLVAQADFGGGPRGAPAPAGPDMNAIIRQAAGVTPR